MCPTNTSNGVKIQKDLKEEYDVLKAILDESLGNAFTAFVFVLLTLCSVILTVISTCICVPCLIKHGRRKLAKIMLLYFSNFIPVSGYEGETSKEIDGSVV